MLNTLKCFCHESGEQAASSCWLTSFVGSSGQAFKTIQVQLSLERCKAFLCKPTFEFLKESHNGVKEEGRTASM